MSGVEWVDWTTGVPEEPGESRVEERARKQPAGEGLGRLGVDPWQLPGMGESGAGCGEFYPEAVCDSCGEVTYMSRTCGKRTCPDCWGSWAKEAAVRATVRIQSFRHTQPDDYRRQVAHSVVSPEEGEIRNARQFWEYRSEAAKIAERKGFRGFAVIGHPWRATEAAKDHYRAEEPEVGFWVWLRNEYPEKIEEYRQWSPHYHVIGATTKDMDPAKDDDEAVYQFFRSVKAYHGPTDRNSHGDVYGLFRYLLSHTGYPEGSSKQVTTWYGDMANSVFVEEATESWQCEKPRESVRERIERTVREVAEAAPDESDGEQEAAESDDGDEVGECSECDDGLLIDVFDVAQYLRQSEPPPEVAERMKAARDWRLGRIEPPPGLKAPSTEKQAREAFEKLL